MNSHIVEFHSPMVSSAGMRTQQGCKSLDMQQVKTRAQATLLFALVVCGTVLGIAGTDLILPAIPRLPGTLGGTAAQAQLVLAAFVAGTAIGLLAFGELGSRHDQRALLCVATLLFALASAAAVFVSSIEALIAIRVVQGAAGSAAAVFAPGIIQSLFPGVSGVRAIGLLGSIESLVPAIAPIAGAWIVSIADWTTSFVVLAIFGFAVSMSLLLVPRDLFHFVASGRTGSYAALLRNRSFLRLALSQAFTLGGLLVFVFGAPAVMVLTMKGKLADFVVMQSAGVVFFIIAANLSARLVARFGAHAVILAGSALSALGAGSILGYALAGGDSTLVVAGLFVPMNLGLGIRGPPGFLQAVVASNGDDARGAALVILAIFVTTALGTTLSAPWIEYGLAPLATIAATISFASVVLLLARQR